VRHRRVAGTGVLGRGVSEKEESGGSMKVFSDEKIKVLAEKNGWSQTQAKGFVDGEASRRRGTAPSKYAQVGIDEYSLAFRAGYYGREIPGSKPDRTLPVPAARPVNSSNLK
jgi:hypothetical protein